MLKVKELKLSQGLLLYLIITTIFFIISSFSSMAIVYAIEKYLSISICVALLTVLVDLYLKNNNVKKLMNSIVIIGLIVLFLTFLYKLKFGFWDRQVRFFINGPIVFGWLMGFYCLLSIHLMNISLNKKVYFILSVIFGSAILWSESKGPFLATTISLIFYTFYRSKRYVQITVFILIILIFLLQNNILSYLEELLNDTRFSSIIRLISGDLSNKDSGSITIRQDMLTESFKLFNDHPFFGIGLGNYHSYTIYDFFYPHNVHLEIFMECGVFIGLIYIIFVLLSFIKGTKIIKTLMLFFIICSSLSGDITYLRFLLALCLISYSLDTNSNRYSPINAQ